MKYRVIGWTNYDDYDIPTGEETFAVMAAIIDDIREHGYI